MEIEPPLSEDPVERMRFYAFVFMELRHRKETMDLLLQAHDQTEKRMHIRMDEMHKLVDEMDKKLRHEDTKMKTVVASIFTFWMFLSGAVAWLWNAAATKAEQHIETVAMLKDEVKTMHTAMVQIQQDVNLVKAVRGQVQTLQDEVSEMKRK